MNTLAVCNAHASQVADDDPEYDTFIRRVSDRFIANVEPGRPVFTTSASGLFSLYLDALPEQERQKHNCAACRSFINRFGGLVIIDQEGRQSPAFWDDRDAGPRYLPAVRAMIHRVSKAVVTGVFVSSEEVWGTPKTGNWAHLSVTPPRAMVYRHALLTAGQEMAIKREDFKNISRALFEFSKATVAQALAILGADAMYRSEKIVGPATFLYNLHAAHAGAARDIHRDNLTWLAVATAPEGFCHPRSSMVGTLLEDITAGMNFDVVSIRFAEKMHPLQYQRPQSPPSAGNIEQAEKIMAKLGAAGSLARRYARLDEIEKIWTPQAKAVCDRAENGRVFGHLKPKDTKNTVQPMNLPLARITWKRFERDILPGATRLEFMAPRIGSYAAIVTAENFDAPPIIQWDNVSRRNPFSWYGYANGSTAESWSIHEGRWVDVTAIALQPSMWFGHYPQHGEGVHFILDGAKDTRNAPAALFSELLKNEFHAIRKTIEAYSANAQLGGKDQGSASGYKIDKSQNLDRAPVGLRVTDSAGNVSTFKIDRWE